MTTAVKDFVSNWNLSPLITLLKFEEKEFSDSKYDIIDSNYPIQAPDKEEKGFISG